MPTQREQKRDGRTHIERAAIFFEGKIYTGRRHSDIIARIQQETGKKPGSGGQGFLTTQCVFVTRQEAAEIAFKAGQTKGDAPLPYLTSEDVW